MSKSTAATVRADFEARRLSAAEASAALVKLGTHQNGALATVRQWVREMRLAKGAK